MRLTFTLARRCVSDAPSVSPSAVVPLIALLALFASGTRASAGIGSWGDAIAHVGDGGHEAWVIGKSQDIGYKYSHVAVFGLNVWTWDGTYCVYQRFEKQYVAITPAQAAKLLRKDERDLQPPFAYRCPLGLFVFGPILALGGFGWYWQVRAKRKRAAREAGTAGELALKKEYREPIDQPAPAGPPTGGGANHCRGCQRAMNFWSEDGYCDGCQTGRARRGT